MDMKALISRLSEKLYRLSMLGSDCDDIFLLMTISKHLDSKNPQWEPIWSLIKLLSNPNTKAKFLDSFVPLAWSHNDKAEFLDSLSSHDFQLPSEFAFAALMFHWVLIESPYCTIFNELHKVSKSILEDLLAQLMKAYEIFQFAITWVFHYVTVVRAFLIELLRPLVNYSKALRPPCLSMPWTIWPALVVLWGVCWMFHPQPNSSIFSEDVLATWDLNLGEHLRYLLNRDDSILT